MPHCIVEYSRETLADGDVAVLLDQLHQAVFATGLYPEPNIKVRAIPVDHVLVAGAPSPFLHATVRILSGKAPEQRRQISEAVYGVLETFRGDVPAITVEIVEMERDSYSKKLSPHS